MQICTDSQIGKKIVASPIIEVGVRCLDCGPRFAVGLVLWIWVLWQGLTIEDDLERDLF